MIQFLAQGIDMPLWLLLILIVIIAVLIVAMFLRPSIPVFSNAEERKAEIALFEDRLQGVLLVDRSQSLRDLERALRIGYWDREGNAALQATLGRWHAKGKVEVDDSGYRLTR